MHNKENLRSLQVHAAAVRVECPALSLSLHFIKFFCLFLPHLDPVLSSVVACLPYLAMVLVLFWTYSEYLCSLQIISKATLKRGTLNN